MTSNDTPGPCVTRRRALAGTSATVSPWTLAGQAAIAGAAVEGVAA